MRKVFLLMAMALLAVFVLSACAPAAAPADGGDGAASTESADAPADGDKVVIDWWHIWAAEPPIADTLQSLADQFMEENPDVEIVITTLENEAYKQKMGTVMQGGEPPDIFQSWGGGVLATYAQAGLVQDLTGPLVEDGWGESIAEGPLALGLVDGKNYAVPWRSNFVGMWYNKDLFEQAGLDPENPPQTWDELLAAVETLKEAGITPITVGAGDKWPAMFWYAMLLSRMASPDEIAAAANRTGGAFNSPGFIAAGEKLEELIALEPFQEGFLGNSYPDAQTLLANGQAAMQLMGNWDYGGAMTLAEDPEAYAEFIGWFPFPAVEGGEGSDTALYGGGDLFAVGINAEPEAVDFVRFLMRPESSQALIDVGAVGFPVVAGTEANYANPAFENIAASMSEGTSFLNFLDQQFLPPLDSAVNEEVQALFAGLASAEDVANNLEKNAQDNLDE